MTLFRPDPRDRDQRYRCRREVRVGNHTFRDLGDELPRCIHCGRLHGKRYKPQARAKWAA